MLILKLGRNTVLYSILAATTLFVLALLYGFLKFYEWYFSELIIAYEIDAPNPPGDGKVMENPSIKVWTVLLWTFAVGRCVDKS